jgi:YD repeat-containing protein
MYSKSDRLTAMIEALIKAMVRLLRHIGLVDQSGNNTFWTYDDEGRLIRESQTGSLDNL